ncbi:MAG: single-stranded DNA-binding protein [Bacteroidota bacterium]
MNNVNLFGTLGQNAIVKPFENGRSVIEFSLATKETWKDKEDNKQSRTTWHNCKIFRKTGSTGISEFLKKGAKIIVEQAFLRYQDREIGDRKILQAYVDVEKVELVSTSNTKEKQKESE